MSTINFYLESFGSEHSFHNREKYIEEYKSPNVHAINKRIWYDMLGSIPHQEIYFYHLPTRGRAGIKLGDADTSPTYL